MHPVLDTAFTWEEVKFALGQLKPGKTPGLDGLCNSFFIELPGTYVTTLTRLYNEVFNTGKVTSDWRCSEILLLQKKGMRKT